MKKGGQSKQKKKIEKGGGAGATHIYTHNFVVRNLLRMRFYTNHWTKTH
jgi:hypothetical protein